MSVLCREMIELWKGCEVMELRGVLDKGEDRNLKGTRSRTGVSV